jgi:hypothetical protein
MWIFWVIPSRLSYITFFSSPPENRERCALYVWCLPCRAKNVQRLDARRPCDWLRRPTRLGRSFSVLHRVDCWLVLCSPFSLSEPDLFYLRLKSCPIFDYPVAKGSELVSQKCSDFQTPRLQTPFPGTRHCEGSGLIRLEVCRNPGPCCRHLDWAIGPPIRCRPCSCPSPGDALGSLPWFSTPRLSRITPISAG